MSVQGEWNGRAAPPAVLTCPSSVDVSSSVGLCQALLHDAVSVIESSLDPVMDQGQPLCRPEEEMHPPTAGLLWPLEGVGMASPAETSKEATIPWKRAGCEGRRARAGEVWADRRKSVGGGAGLPQRRGARILG